MPPLFRQQAVKAQQQKLTGDVILTQPLSLSTCVLLIAACATIIALLVCNSQYTRKETVQGILQPDKGALKVYAGRRGVLEEILVKEGDVVQAGQIIARVLYQSPNINGKSLLAEKVVHIEEQLGLVESNIQQSFQQEGAEKQRLALMLTKLQNTAYATAQIGDILQEKLALFEQRHLRITQLAKNGHVSRDTVQEFEQAHLQIKQEFKQNRSTLSNITDEVSLVQHQQQQVENDFTVKRRELKAQKVSLNTQLAEVKASKDNVIKAHQSGKVTAIHRHAGNTIEASQPILTMVPKGAQLVAEILLPTRSAGFITTGKHAKLRFDAFPHQRFGFINSTITHIEKTVITAQESSLPISIREPMYRIRAVLDEQSVNAYGEHFPLRSGMYFQADIHLDSRSLLDWIFDPIYSLKGEFS
ncbi:HlyD family secretion protein [Thalassotalea fusca]